MKYTIGTKIRIDPKPVLTGFSCGVIEEMLPYKGKCAKIVNIWGSFYQLDIDESAHSWDEEWLKPFVLNKGR